MNSCTRTLVFIFSITSLLFLSAASAEEQSLGILNASSATVAADAPASGQSVNPALFNNAQAFPEKSLLISLVTDQQVKVAAALANNKKPTLDLGVEKELVAYLNKVEASCAVRVANVNSSAANSAAKSAHINALGLLVALVGSVTVYVPAKVVLIGIGISSAGGGDSVLGSMVNYENAAVKSERDSVLSMQRDFNQSLNDYEKINPLEDITGHDRMLKVFRAQASCDGLASHSAN